MAGRPREYRNAAEKQKAYRDRKNQEKQLISQIKALRNSTDNWERPYLYAGDACICCGFTIHWAHDIEMRKWTLTPSFKRYRHMPILRFPGWRLVAKQFLVCPECATECDCFIPIAPVAKIGWGEYELYLVRTGVG